MLCYSRKCIMELCTLLLGVIMSNNNCVVPEVRKNVWVVYDLDGKRIGEVGANSESEARLHVAKHIMIPFTLSHIEE